MLYRRSSGWELVALGMNGVALGDRQLYSGERCDIRGTQTISLFPYSLTLDLPKAAETTREHQRQMLDERLSALDPRYSRRGAAANGSHRRMRPRRLRSTTNICCAWNGRSTTLPAVARSWPAAARRWSPTWPATDCAIGCSRTLTTEPTTRRARSVHRSALEPAGHGRARARSGGRFHGPLHREANPARRRRQRRGARRGGRAQILARLGFDRRPHSRRLSNRTSRCGT